MNGELDPLYVDARRALLDMLEALASQRDAVVLVGAQAIYLHVGEGELAIAPFTIDADLALDPRHLMDHPLLEQLLRAEGFLPSGQSGAVGTWVAPIGRGVPVDLLVPEALEPQGGRAAKLGDHGPRTARRARGLEAAVVDRDRLTVSALDVGDPRSFEVWVAGPAALLVAKLHKIAERVEQPGRLRDKDALDVYRLLLEIQPQEFRTRFEKLVADDVSAPRTREAIVMLRQLFGETEAPGTLMLVRSVSALEDEAQIAMSCAFLAQEVLQALQGL